MNRHNQQVSLTPKALIYRIAVAVAVLPAVCLYMPRNEHPGYQFHKDEPWRYSQLIAPYDFSIDKSEEAIRAERDSILQYYEPYFAIDPAVGREQAEKFKAAMKGRKPAAMSAKYQSYVESKLEHIYSQGVMDSKDYDRMHSDKVAFIRMFAQNTAKEQATGQVYSLKTAYEYLIDLAGEDSLRYDREVLRKCDLSDYIVPNLTYDEEKSEESRKDLLNSLSLSSGNVVRGQKIIDYGEIVNQKTYEILISLEKKEAERSPSASQLRTMLAGQFLYVALIIACLVLYFSLFRRDYLANIRHVLFIASMPVIFPLLTLFLVRHNLFSVYVIPFAMVPVFIRVFMDSRTAMMTHAVTVLISAICLKSPYEFAATQLVSGMVSIYSLRELSQRSQLIRSAFHITLVSAAFYMSMELMRNKDFGHLEYGVYMYILINGILLLFAYPLLLLFEKVFGFTSNVTLVELCNTNNDLLRRLSEVAPGTFQHSMQVANLATEVANRIGAKALLVRTGALYHDIGKTNNPAYFTENQKNFNPHELISHEQSAAIVIGHVRDGLRLAEKHNLPQVIKDFISTHHGKGKTKYFLISCKNENPGRAVDESPFTYGGPNPWTPEQAILMMSDAVEAASRSLDEYTEESISGLVDKIVDGQVQEGFFKDCALTFHDISAAKEVLKEKLRTIYHTRISYPEPEGEQAGPRHIGSTSK